MTTFVIFYRPTNAAIGYAEGWALPRVGETLDLTPWGAEPTKITGVVHAATGESLEDPRLPGQVVHRMFPQVWVG